MKNEKANDGKQPEDKDHDAANDPHFLKSNGNSESAELVGGDCQASNDEEGPQPEQCDQDIDATSKNSGDENANLALPDEGGEHYEPLPEIDRSEKLPTAAPSDFDSQRNPTIDGEGNCPGGSGFDQQIWDAVRLMLDGPVDLPARRDAIVGLTAALVALQIEVPSVTALLVQIQGQIFPLYESGTDDATVLSLSRRKGKHLLYALAREIGAAIGNERELDDDLLRLFGFHCIRRLLTDYLPSSGSIAKLRTSLLFPGDRKALCWSRSARARAINMARRGLSEALATNPRAAEEFGLSVRPLNFEKPKTAIEQFNAAFRRRVENLIDFATLDAVAASGGYDTLCAAGLLHAGQQVLNMALSGDRGMLVVALEVVSHLPSEGVLLIPAIRDGIPPKDALAWLDLTEGTYSQILYRILERGAKVAAGREHLYEKTTQIVTIHLSPPFHQLLRDLDDESGRTAVNVEGLTGPVAHCARSAIVEGGGYRITARRMQESVPTLLLQEGFHRWPVALATNSHFLVTRGRRAYGACRLVEINKVTARSCELLGWPKPAFSASAVLVGARTVPTDQSISQGLNFLCDRANAFQEMDSYESVCESLNALAEWLAMLEALVFALRQWLIYEIDTKEIRREDLVKFNDKDVHEYEGPGIPVVRLVSDAIACWHSLCLESIVLLREFSDSRSADLAIRIEAHIIGDDFNAWIFTINPIGNITPIGYKTWYDALPSNLRLQPNFSRQYWPLKLMDRKVKQSLMDLLMRHQLDSIPPGTSRSLAIQNRSMTILRTAMEATIDSLNLRIPKKLLGECNVK
jgi:hypothetical protein